MSIIIIFSLTLHKCPTFSKNWSRKSQDPLSMLPAQDLMKLTKPAEVKQEAKLSKSRRSTWWTPHHKSSLNQVSTPTCEAKG